MKKIAIIVVVVIGAAAFFLVKSGKAPQDILQQATDQIQNANVGRGTVVDVTGKVAVVRADGKQVTASTNTTIREGDHITTDGSSRCTVQFEDETTATISPKTDLQVAQLDKKVTARVFTCQLKLDAGKIMMDVPTGPTRQSTVSVVTPSGTLGVRGTKFLTAVDEDKTTRVAVFAGQVEVTGKDKTVVLAAQEATLVKLGEAPKAPVKMLPAPVFALPAHEGRIKTEKIPIKLGAVEGAKGYVIELARNPQVTHVAAEVTTDKTAFDLPGPTTDGPYYLRVSALNELGLAGALSEVRTVFYQFRMGGQNP